MHKFIDGGRQANDGVGAARLTAGKQVNLQDPINPVCD